MRRDKKMQKRLPGGAIIASMLGLLTVVSGETQAAVACQRTVTADVVAIDQPVVFNRLGAQNVNYMIYALRRDVVNTLTNLPLTNGGAAVPGQVALRADKRARPLTLRVAAGDCLQVNFQNLLTPVANPFNAAIPQLQLNNQVADRHAGFQPLGLQLATGIADYSANVGKNANNLANSGESRTYTFFAEKEGAFMVYSYGAPFGGEASGGNIGVGLFGVVNVEPANARFYRSQATEEERRLATIGTTANGQPILDYEARYPNDCATNGVWCLEGKAGLPILNMLDGNNLVHSDINAVIAGPNADGTFPPSTYPLESQGERNPTVPNRLEAFREFTVVFHDETAAAQAFPAWFADPVLRHTLHGVRDSFMINYGSGGIGSEIIANRLGVGPQHDCLSCAYEEFFLTAYAVGDPAMQVDIPANAGLEACDPALNNCLAVGPKATAAYFPDDPSNVHHSYVGDFVKFRNLHAGPKEQHVFHLHNHQWLFNPNDDNSNYIDAQGIGPGSAYTYEINFGGSGNRNKSAGDAIFHCHFYPHFAQGMWEMWRIHDTTETGTVLTASGGTPAAPDFHGVPFALQNGMPMPGSRALPDGEILAGTPIPALIPLPGKAMAPMPGAVQIVTKDANGDGIPESSQALVVDRTVNPGFPFWVAGIEDAVGQRPPTPPLDMLTEAEATTLKNSGDPLFDRMDPKHAGGWDGGLPRHSLDGYVAGGTAIASQNRLDMSKKITRAKPIYYDEKGTDVERVAMAFHAQRNHASFAMNMDGTTVASNFVTNGNKPLPSAPYAEPCIDDTGALFLTGQQGSFFDGHGGLGTIGTPRFGADNPRVYKGANIQIDAVLNKVGYHFPQQRIITLWEDVAPTMANQRPPEPFVIRLNTFDCAKYLHTNLVPEVYEMDDYQVRTPTDIIGQHIHLPKWDLTTTDGSGNGWNYEDGTLSPGMVQERIHAINNYNDTVATPVLSGKENAANHLEPLPHPFFGAGPNNHWLGARTTIQRWFADPVVNVAGEDRGLGIIFTHDHYGPSTHQQIGLYATVLVEPANSTWVHNETGTPMYTRADGGPTSWQAAILSDTTGDGTADQGFREFYFEFSEMQHAYEKGIYVGVGPTGEPIGQITLDANGQPVAPGGLQPRGRNFIALAADQTFRFSINPSFRQSTVPAFPDILLFPALCPGGVPRPCPEAISADDVGLQVANYRNEPVGLRVYDPAKLGPDGKPGSQANGLAGDLAFALQTRTDRAIAQLNTALGDTPYPAMTGGVQKGDPFTPMIRAYPNDLVKIKIQAGGDEHEHNATIHGVKWLQSGSGHGAAPNSGWRNAQNDGISEQFTFTMPVGNDVKAAAVAQTDYLYSMDASQDGWWSGMWGIMRAYSDAQADLKVLPNNANPKPGRIVNRADFDGVCPLTAPVREYHVVAVSANEVLQNGVGVNIVPNDLSATMHVGGPLNPAGGTLVYNPRATQIAPLQVVADNGAVLNLGGQAGPLHDPTGLMFVRVMDLEPVNPAAAACADTPSMPGVTKPACQVRLKATAPVEPLVLRADAGDCVKVQLHNRLYNVVPDLAGYNTLLQVVNRDRQNVQGLTTFNNNLIRPSGHVGIHPQLVEYDMTQSDGVNVGLNPVQTVAPVIVDAKTGAVTQSPPKTYVWYAGHHEAIPTGQGTQLNLVATPVEFGGANLTPADKIKQGQKGMVGALSVQPVGATFPDMLAGLEMTRDHQVANVNAQRATRAQATVSTATGNFRDMTVVLQKGLNHRYADGSAVPNIASEGLGFPEDAHDSAQAAINYGSEPLWFRFGLPPDAPFGLVGLGGVTNAYQAYSNLCCANGGTATTADANIGDPVTPVMTAAPGQGVRMRVLEPTGVGRGTTFALHGHQWQRDPYLAGTVPSQTIGHNPIGMTLGHQESVTPNAHFDVVPANGAGGAGAIEGDYLFLDQGSFGSTNGLWGILRVGLLQ